MCEYDDDIDGKLARTMKNWVTGSLGVATSGMENLKEGGEMKTFGNCLKEVSEGGLEVAKYNF
jgi:hypothetical protein